MTRLRLYTPTIISTQTTFLLQEAESLEQYRSEMDYVLYHILPVKNQKGKWDHFALMQRTKPQHFLGDIRHWTELTGQNRESYKPNYEPYCNDNHDFY